VTASCTDVDSKQTHVVYGQLCTPTKYKTSYDCGDMTIQYVHIDMTITSDWYYREL